jgi:hypothetical protein
VANHAACTAAMQIFSDSTRGLQLGAMRLPAAGPGSRKRLHEFTATAARRRGRYGRAPLLWYGCYGLSACQQSGGFGRATTATQTDGHRTAQRKGHGAGKVELCAATIEVRAREQSTVRSSMYRAVVSNSVGSVADVQRRLPAAKTHPQRAGCCLRMGWYQWLDGDITTSDCAVFHENEIQSIAW